MTELDKIKVECLVTWTWHANFGADNEGRLEGRKCHLVFC